MVVRGGCGERQMNDAGTLNEHHASAASANAVSDAFWKKNGASLRPRPMIVSGMRYSALAAAARTPSSAPAGKPRTPKVRCGAPITMVGNTSSDEPLTPPTESALVA